jgi:hypothetical protein
MQKHLEHLKQVSAFLPSVPSLLLSLPSFLPFVLLSYYALPPSSFLPSFLLSFRPSFRPFFLPLPSIPSTLPPLPSFVFSSFHSSIVTFCVLSPWLIPVLFSPPSGLFFGHQDGQELLDTKKNAVVFIFTAGLVFGFVLARLLG